MRRIPLLLLLFTLLYMAPQAVGQEKEKRVKVSMEGRADLNHISIAQTTQSGESGFGGYITNLIVEGEISPQFSFSYRQRLNKWNKVASYFDSVDKVLLSYWATDRLSFSVGKSAIALAGWELDLAPIDCFFLSSFNYHYNPYQWGGSATLRLGKKEDLLTLQLVESPFSEEYTVRSGNVANMLGFSLKWDAKHAFWQPNWSLNLFEYSPKRYIGYLSLGNRFFFGDKVTLEVDYMNRTAAKRDALAKDFTLVGNLIYQPIAQLELYGKYTWDYNATASNADYVVTPNTDIKRIGGGIHYYPIRDRSIRLHANYSYSFGNNTQPLPYVRHQLSALNIGVTWRFSIL